MSGPKPPRDGDATRESPRRLAAQVAPEEAHLSSAEFKLIRDRVSHHCGVDLPTDQRTSVERRLRERLAALGLEGDSAFRDYVRLLQAEATGRTELDEAVELLTTNETYFFREDYQLRAFREEVVPMLARQAQGRKRLTIWSAGCSTGEEAYTIATILLDTPELAGWELRVIGTDISRRCIAHARRATYGAASFRVTPSDARKRWFIDRADGALVAERVRQICHFSVMNLLEPERAASIGRVDAIFCRNVLIYLRAAARRSVIDLFQERLYPGGVLLLGHSESLLNASTSFDLLHLKSDLVYRKPTGAPGYMTPRPFMAAPAASEPAPPEPRKSTAPGGPSAASDTGRFSPVPGARKGSGS
ncbi:MAG: CheR family methyltransferase [Polyangiales bacterium]